MSTTAPKGKCSLLCGHTDNELHHYDRDPSGRFDLSVQVQRSNTDHAEVCIRRHIVIDQRMTAHLQTDER